MEHLLLAWIFDLILTIDRMLQKRLPAVLANVPDLWDDPETVLEREEVVIGPLRRYAAAVALGFAVYVILTCGVVLNAADRRPARQAPPPPPVVVVVVVLSILALGLVLCILFFWHILRGGRLILRREGAVFIYRGQQVFCPWELFRNGGAPRWLHRSRVALPIWEPAVDGVVRGRNWSVQQTGRAIRCKPIRFLKGPEVAVQDLYALRLDDVATLLLHLGRSLGSKPAPVRPLPVDDDY